MLLFHKWMRIYSCHPWLRLRSLLSSNLIFLKHRILITHNGCRHEVASFSRFLARPLLYRRNPFVVLKFYLFPKRHIETLELQRMVPAELRWVTVWKLNDIPPRADVELEDLVNWVEMKELS